MIGRALAVAAVLLVATQLHAQTNQPQSNAAQGTTSGPAAGTPTSMRSPQAGPLETKHQRKVIRNQSQSVRVHGQAARARNDETGATGSSTPPYTSPPR